MTVAYRRLRHAEGQHRLHTSKGRTMPQQWQSSRRSRELPKNWAVLRTRVIKRDGSVCKECKTYTKNPDVDHIVPGDNHSLSKLQGHCQECRKKRPAAEAAAARRRMRARRARPREGRPGGERAPRWLRRSEERNSFSILALKKFSAHPQGGYPPPRGRLA